MTKKIENLNQLRQQIGVLKAKRKADEAYFSESYNQIKHILETPSRWISNVFSFLGFSDEQNKNSDWVTSLGRIAVPFLLSKTIFRKSNLLVKTLVSLISQKAINASNLNKNFLASWIDKLTEWIDETISSKKEEKPVDFGIPPDSETY